MGVRKAGTARAVIDPEIRSQAEEILADLGLSASKGPHSQRNRSAAYSAYQVENNSQIQNKGCMMY